MRRIKVEKNKIKNVETERNIKKSAGIRRAAVIAAAVSLGLTACQGSLTTGNPSSAESSAETDGEEKTAETDSVGGSGRDAYSEEKTEMETDAMGKTEMETYAEEKTEMGMSAEEKTEMETGAMGNTEMEMSAEEMAGKKEPAASGGMDNFSVDKSEAQAFAGKIQKAVEEKDLEAFADCISFPTYVGFKDEGIVVNTREEFLAFGEKKIFTDDFVTSIKNTDITALEASMAGFHMQDRPNEKRPGINFGVVDGTLAVNGINYF